MKISETELNDEILQELIALSVEWENEDSCYGYRSNRKDDIEGNRIFIAEEEGEIIAYLFGHSAESKDQSSIIPDGTVCFEVMEIYVRKEYRNQGIGTALVCKTMEYMKSDGYAYAIIGWVTDAEEFYKKTLNAKWIENSSPDKSVYSNKINLKF